MPKAKKDQVVSLTKVKPKTRDHKEYIVEKARLLLKKFKNLYVLTFDNMTTNNFKALKEALPDSKFLMGKNRVLATAFGTDEESSFKPNSFRVGELLKGHCTLFFTNKSNEEVSEIFDQFSEEEYATGGNVADKTIILYAGFESLKRFSHSMEPHLRQLGLPTRLVNSKIELMSDYMVCQEGKPITVSNCKVLVIISLFRNT